MIISEARSKIMRSVSKKDTKPEIFVRSLLHRMGLRFRLHPKNLPGTPDIVLRKYRTVIFVHGCFWHRHLGCRYASTPKTRLDFWLPKFESNIQRDSKKEAQLRDLGWRVLVVWECETRLPDQLKIRLAHDLLGFGSVGNS
ncbi:very short patch repair endonuclease [Pseudomonas cannabina]|uniref:Very short patch repair endonuclease n=2 Tax=Pseudomonas syringae group genomosp. 3 TaxID=251701 RepID=A0A8T8C8G1_PSEYM|nr:MULTISPECIES: DNA mismatch endonuclease Vsr [Pseudomonas syringae group]QHE99828.1 DNA mismatch endonuclease Vsr [Pseudomonas syringae pv. maculicola str. ES4326]QQN21862.1 DNA mismatch endonuclease Vsr [Pseudomonas cannabina pv. alisalensis]UBY95532.1 DNA mismatch endonuclease Vsr [Pseudomonas cannabina pv. alisalensis]